MPHVRPRSVVDSALAASASGLPDANNAPLHGVAVKTIRRWRRLYQRRGQTRGQQHLAPPCPQCAGEPLPRASYAELLGWYLGDGYISEGRREVYNLHIYNDIKHVNLNSNILELMRAVKPASRPHNRLVPGTVISTVCWKHWPCLFPQHGPDRKHERRIALEPRQEEIVAQFPTEFLRGLVPLGRMPDEELGHADVAGKKHRYDYPRWQFTNRSDDIRALCCWALDLVDVAWRQSGQWTISVSRREAVSVLDVQIGPKS